MSGGSRTRPYMCNIPDHSLNILGYHKMGTARCASTMAHDRKNPGRVTDPPLQNIKYYVYVLMLTQGRVMVTTRPPSGLLDAWI